VSSDELVALVCCDYGSIVRGRSLIASELGARLDNGVGWTPANHSLTPVGTLAEPNPFGSLGDLRLLPDPDTHMRVEGLIPLELVLCDIVETDGRPWECCPRNFLRESLRALEREIGAKVLASFEHEFQLVNEEPAALAFSLDAQRAVEPFAARVMGALLQAGVQPEMFTAEYGAHQFEIPVEPAEGIGSADRSIVLKEVVRELARRHAVRASFTPLLDPAWPGNGVHIHLSLLDSAGRPLFYDAERLGNLSELGGHFAAGVLLHARALSAMTAPSPISATRLGPHRWSAGAICLAQRNREALLRIPPLLDLDGGDRAVQMRLEYRGADATANPYLALGAIIMAGLEGVRAKLPAPPILQCDPAELDEIEAERYGVGAQPSSLEESLEALAEDETARSWMGERLYDAYLAVKRAELAEISGLDSGEVCRRYAAIY
jgi:glutamine synthetase